MFIGFGHSFLFSLVDYTPTILPEKYETPCIICVKYIIKMIYKKSIVISLSIFYHCWLTQYSIQTRITKKPLYVCCIGYKNNLREIYNHSLLIIVTRSSIIKIEIQQTYLFQTYFLLISTYLFQKNLYEYNTFI